MLILLLIIIPLAESTTCCNKKEIVGDSPESGVYWLVSSNETRCADGCSYSKDNITNIFYCFSDVTYVAGGAGVEYVLPPAFNGTVHVVDCSSVVRTADDNWAIQQVIIPETITQGGTWGPREFCDSGSFATGFVLRYAPLCVSRCNFDDDTALMGIWLNCGPYNDTSQESGVISSSVLPDYKRVGGGSSKGFVSTTRLNCPANSFLTQSQFLSEYYAGEDTSGGISCPPNIICTSFSSTFDPIGGMNLNMKCSDGTQLNGTAVPQSERADTSLWSGWTICPTGFAVCGIQTKVDAGTNNNVDALGIAQVSFSCCSLPPEFA